MTWVGSHLESEAQQDGLVNLWKIDTVTGKSIQFFRSGPEGEDWGAATLALTLSDSGTNDSFVLSSTAAWVSDEHYAEGSWAKLEENYVNSIDVTFDLNYENSENYLKHIVKGHAFSLIKGENPSRVGYDFGGWYAEKACENAIADDFVITEARTVYAKWTESVAKSEYKIVGEGVDGSALAGIDWSLEKGYELGVDSKNLAYVLGISLKKGDIFKLHNGTEYLGWSSVKGDAAHAYFKEAATDGNIEVAVSGTFDIYLNSSKEIFVFDKNARGTTLYLEPNAEWKQANATFAAYLFNDTENTWAALTKVNDDLYSFDLTGVADYAKYTKIIFVRLKPSTDGEYKADNGGLNWDNKWNQTADLDIPLGGLNRYVISATSCWNLYIPA